MRTFLYALSVLVAAAFLFVVSTTSEAVHRGAGDMTCGACHTMHNAQGGSKIVTTATTGGLVLLRSSVTSRGDIPGFCLSCHAESGAQAGTIMKPKNITPPKVLRTSLSWDQSKDWTTIGAGGDFRWVLNTTTYAVNSNDNGTNASFGYGHSVGATISVTAPGGGPTYPANEFSCTHCHDPHGAPDTAVATSGVNRFRNLKVAPNGGTGVSLTSCANEGSASAACGAAATWSGAGSSSTANHIWPLTMTTNCAANGDCNLYASGNDGQREGISGWCAQCHPDWHEDTAGSQNNAGSGDWRRHPVNNAMSETGSTTSGANVVIVDYTWYTTGIPAGFQLPIAENTLTVNGPVGATDKYFANEADDRVFCLSCHFAHGGPYLDALRWDYLVTVALGDMTGSGVPSNIGCQQCHNR